MEAVFPAFFCFIWVIGLAVSVAGTVFWIWMIIDCVTKETDENNNRLIWVLIIVLTHVIGAAIYYFVRRPARIRELGQ